MPNSKPSLTSDAEERPLQGFKYRWLVRYAAAGAAVGAGFLMRLGLTALVGEGLPTYITFYPVIMAVALLGGVGPGLLATVATALAVDYWILPPVHEFGIASLVDAVGLAFFSGMGVFMSVVAELYRRARQKAAAHDTELLWREGQQTPRQAIAETVLLVGGLILSLAILGGAGWQTYRELAATAQADRWVSHTYIVDDELEHLYSTLEDMEASERGYLIMGEEDYLRPYISAKRIVAGQFASLKRLTADNLGQTQRLTALEALVDAKLAELKAVIEVRRSQGLEAARALMATSKGQPLTEEIRKLVTEAEEEEQRLLQARTTARDTDLRKTHQALLAGGVLSLLLLTTVFLFLKQENTRRRRAERELRQHRDRLRELVAARTAELGRRVADLQIVNEALRQSEERYRSLVELSPEALFVNRNDRIVLVNPAALQLFGASSPEQLLGKSPFDLFHSDFHALMRERISKVLVGERAPVLEEKIVRLDGVVVDVEVVGSPVTDQGERAVQVLLRDITERKRAEEALRQTAEDLQRSNHDLEQFAYVASHDLQEPLRAVGGYVKLLERRLANALDAKARDYVAGAVDGALRMERLINDLLAFSRVGTHGGTFVSVELDAVLDQALRNLQAGIESAHATVTHDPLPTLSVDATQIMQLFQNLIGNALKFHGEQPPKIHIGAQRQDERWVFAVRDNGIGIEPQYFERIFQIFQRLHTRREYPGTGIGLAICKRIIERHGGAIWVESRLGQGATFYFSIPETKG